MEKIRKHISSIIAVILSLGIILSNVPFDVKAAETLDDYVTEGSYNYNEEGGNDATCIFRDDCFMRSSYLGCTHLLQLSMETALASINMNGSNPNPLEADVVAETGRITSMLESIGFEDAVTNNYYKQPTLENSSGVALGHKEIKANGKTYTLIAILLRSNGYKQEWGGNFDVGDGDYHEGIKSARDEALRFTKQYIADKGISGDIKVWIAGHSRGAAVSNALGGFFAGGGIDYFGGTVSITPEDVYCYSLGQPRIVKNGIDKNTELSVEGARGGIYADDTPGAAYTYTGGGTTDTQAEIYNGLKNFIPDYDLITQLPPDEWGFGYYGKTLPLDDGGNISVDAMKAELKTINQSVYNDFDKGDYRSFTPSTFDLATLQIVPDPNPTGATTTTEFMKQRVSALAHVAPTNKEYVSGGAQDVLRSAGGLYGTIAGAFSNGIPEDKGIPAKAIFATYLAYASERLIEEGRAANEEESVAIAFADALKFLTGKELDPNTATVDDAILLLTGYIDSNPDSALVNTLMNAVADALPEGSTERSFLIAFTSYFYVSENGEQPTLQQGFLALLRACYSGPDPRSMAPMMGMSTAEDVRYGILYPLLVFVIGEAADATTLIGSDSQDRLVGNAPFKGFCDVIPAMVFTVKDDAGKVTIPYTNINDAADREVESALELYLRDAVEASKSDGDAVYRDATRHLDTLEANIPQTRRLLTNLLFYTEGVPYSTDSVVKNATTLLANVSIIPMSHYPEIYLAWTKAATPTSFGFSDHYIEKIAGTPATCTKDGTVDQYILHDLGQETVFNDKYLSKALTRNELTTPMLGHEPGDKVVENRVEATYEKAGSYEEATYCVRCGRELSRVKVEIPKLTKDEKKDDPKNDNKDKNTQNNQNNQKKNNIKTGDATNVVLLAVLMILSAVIIIGILVLKRRQKSDPNQNS
ncbi:MAG: hypothetical protein IJ619_11010 [Eubacterium sp.]|nr:hypothetical protein [Eubacterium sp.]